MFKGLPVVIAVGSDTVDIRFSTNSEWLREMADQCWRDSFCISLPCSGLVLWLSLAETKYSKAPLGQSIHPWMGPLAVKPHTREYCRCEMTAPMTAPLCWDFFGFLKHVEIGIGLGFTIVLIEIGEPFGNGSTEWVKMGWCKAKQQNPSNNQPKSQNQTVKRTL